jgi:hypothetical protein
MPPEALWVQQAGISYDASEDRRLISAMSTVGVANGFVITATTGLGISVSAGTAIVDDGSGGAYVAYTTSATTLTLTNGTTNVYVTVNTTTGLTTVTSGSTPSGPFLTLAAVTAASGAITLIPNGGVSLSRAAPPNVSGQFLKLSGGTVTGEILAARLAVTGKFAVGGADSIPDAPLGIKMGGSSAAFGRCYARPYMEAAQNVPNATWTTVNMTNASPNYAYPGQGVPYSITTNRFTCPVAGVYTAMGNCYFADPTGTNVGKRIAAILRRNAASAEVWRHQGAQGSAADTQLAGVHATMDCAAGDTLELQAYQGQGTTVQLTNGSFAGATESLATFTLVQPF